MKDQSEGSNMSINIIEGEQGTMLVTTFTETATTPSSHNGCVIKNEPLGILHLSSLFSNIEKRIFLSKDSS